MPTSSTEKVRANRPSATSDFRPCGQPAGYPASAPADRARTSTEEQAQVRHPGCRARPLRPGYRGAGRPPRSPGRPRSEPGRQCPAASIRCAPGGAVAGRAALSSHGGLTDRPACVRDPRDRRTRAGGVLGALDARSDLGQRRSGDSAMALSCWTHSTRAARPCLTPRSCMRRSASMRRTACCGTCCPTMTSARMSCTPPAPPFPWPGDSRTSSCSSRHCRRTASPPRSIRRPTGRGWSCCA
jgi:hypothetical protein